MTYHEMMTGQNNNFDRLHLQVLGYRPWLFANLAPLFYIFVVSLALIIISVIAQLCVGKPEEKRPNIAMIC